MSLSPDPSSKDNLPYRSNSPLPSNPSASNLITDIPLANLTKKIPSKRQTTSSLALSNDSSLSSSSRSYRDRAEERRKGLTLDYQDTEAILSMLNPSSTFFNSNPSKQPQGHVEMQSLDGHKHVTQFINDGDLSRVYGQNQVNIQTQSHMIPSSSLASSHTMTPPVTGNKLTPFIKTVLEAALKKPKPPPLTNPHCYPGRMAYLFSPEKGDFTVVLRSTDQANDLTREHFTVLSQVIALLSSSTPLSTQSNSNVSFKKETKVPSTSMSTDSEWNQLKRNETERKPLSSFELVSDGNTTKLASDEEYV